MAEGPLILFPNYLPFAGKSLLVLIKYCKVLMSQNHYSVDLSNVKIISLIAYRKAMLKCNKNFTLCILGMSLYKLCPPK